MRPLAPLLCALPLLLAACRAAAPAEDPPVPHLRHLNPDGLHANPAFTQAIAVEGPHRTVWVGGQNAVDAEGRIVGEGDLGAQAEQVARNLETALAAAGAGLEHVVRWNVYVVEGQPLHEGLAGFQRVLGPRMAAPPTICVLVVAGLAHPAFLLEVDAVAAVPVTPSP